MTIAIGDRLPSATFKEKTADGAVEITTDELFKGKKVVLVRGAGRVYPDLHPQSPAGLPGKPRRDPGTRCG